MFSRSSVDNIIVTGKSGAGKQPRIDVLVKEFRLQQLSTGNIFREYIGVFDASGYDGDLSRFYITEEERFIPDREMEMILGKRLPEHDDIRSVMLGLKAKYFVNAGKFGPDDLVNELVEFYLGKDDYKGKVLDGYPRTLNQAEFLVGLCRKEGTGIDLVVLVDNDDEKIVERTIGRRICNECGKVYHIEYKPSKDNIHCDACGGRLIQRSDDEEGKIRSRLKEFHDKVVPTLAYLEKEGIPKVVVPGNLEVFTEENVRRSVMDRIAPLLVD